MKRFCLVMLASLPRLTAIEFHFLLDLNKEETEVEDTRSKTLHCTLGSDRFEVIFEPGVPNVNLLGRCGGALTGMVTVSRNGKALLDQKEFDNLNCHERKRMIDTIVFRAGSSRPRLHSVGYGE